MYEVERCERPPGLASQLFGRQRLMNAAFPLTFLRGLWGEMCISSATAASHIKVLGRGDISLFVLQAVWPFGCRSWAQTVLEKKNTAHTHAHPQTEQSFGFIIIMNWIKSFWLTTDWKTRVSFSLFHISQPLWVQFFLSSFLPLRQDYWGLKSKSTSSSRPAWLAFHAEVRSKLKHIEYLKKTKTIATLIFDVVHHSGNLDACHSRDDNWAGEARAY